MPQKHEAVMTDTLLLVIGAADTGRAPLTAALLRKRLAHYGALLRVESAGVLGHDDDPATGEAIAAADQLGLDLTSHRARSLSDALADEAALLVAINSEAARVARARFPQAAPRTHTLGELAGSGRDIPDPFKMQLGPWLAYAREIDELIVAALPRIREHLPAAPAAPPVAEPAAPTVSPERAAAAQRIAELLGLATRMPGVVDWAAARAQIETDLGVIQATPTGPADMAPAYTGLLRAALALTPAPPTPGKLAALAEATALLDAPVSSAALQAFSKTLAGWAAL
jgi:protein-tyrosine phosphatase